MSGLLKVIPILLGIGLVNCSGDTTQVASPTIVISNGSGSIPSTLNPGTGTSGNFDSIRVGIYGHNPECSNAPRNSENIVRKGCVAGITATPKLNGQDVPEPVHGPDCKWYFNGQLLSTGGGSSSSVSVQVDSNPFNIFAQGLASGTFTLQAEVQSKRSDVITFRVE